jgi:hypothetical protein
MAGIRWSVRDDGADHLRIDPLVALNENLSSNGTPSQVRQRDYANKAASPETRMNH